MYFWCPVTFQFWYINWKQNSCSISSVRLDDQKWQEGRELNLFFFFWQEGRQPNFFDLLKVKCYRAGPASFLPATTPRPAIVITHHWATEACMEWIFRNMNATFHIDVYVFPRFRMFNNLPRLNVNNCPTICDYVEFYYTSCRQLYMFRLIVLSTIRSTFKL